VIMSSEASIDDTMALLEVMVIMSCGAIYDMVNHPVTDAEPPYLLCQLRILI
jgi:hypothetical protein